VRRDFGRRRGLDRSFIEESEETFMNGETTALRLARYCRKHHLGWLSDGVELKGGQVEYLRADSNGVQERRTLDEERSTIDRLLAHITSDKELSKFERLEYIGYLTGTTLAPILVHGRSTYGLSAEQAAKAAGVSTADYVAFEKGRLNPDDATIKKLSKVLGVDESLLKRARDADARVR
jgi:DNA-binding XRE family transcriptional regulator